jgi:hypothetical protein
VRRNQMVRRMRLDIRDDLKAGRSSRHMTEGSERASDRSCCCAKAPATQIIDQPVVWTTTRRNEAAHWNVALLCQSEAIDRAETKCYGDI